MGDDLPAGVVDELLLRALALVRRLELDVDVRQVVRLLLVVADGGDGVEDALGLLELGGEARRGEARLVEARALRRAEADLVLRLVLVGEEVLVRGAGERKDREERRDARQHDHPAVQHRPAEDAHVEALDRAVDAARVHVAGRARVAVRAGLGLGPDLAGDLAGDAERRAGLRVGLLLLDLSLEPPRAHHRREREADEQAHHDGEAHRQAERRHEAPDDAAHEGDGEEDGDEGERRREDGEADLLRAVDRGLERLLPVLVDALVDDLQHDDRVVDDDADGEREREERDRVQREAGRAHDAERADDRRRDGDRGDDRGAQVGEEHEHDDGRADGAEDEVLLHGADGVLDELGLVARDVDVVARGDALLHVRELLFDVVDDLGRVGAALLAHVEDDGGAAAFVAGGVRIGGAVLDGADVREVDRHAAGHGDDDVAHLLDGLHAALRAERELPRACLDAAGGDLQVLRAERAFDLRRREAVALELGGIDPDVHLAGATADDRHLADAADRLDLAADLLVGELRDVARRPRSCERDRHDRRRVRVHLLNDRRIDAARERGHRRAHLVAHLLGRDLDVLLQDERHDDDAHAFAGDAAELVDAADRVDGGLELVTDLRLDLLGRRAAEDGRDHDSGEVDLGEAVDPELEVREETDDAEHEDEHRREDGALDTDGR